jgi:phage-related protein
MGGGGKKGAKGIPWGQVFSWTFDTARSMWQALSPVWTVINKLWSVVRPLWGEVHRIWAYIKTYVVDTYVNYIKPILDKIDFIFSEIEKIVNWVDKLYISTIGRIEDIYNKLFGRFEELWKTFEEFRDKTLRLIASVNEELSQKLYEATEKLEAQTIGRIREARDELLHTIDKVYTELRNKINDFYYAVKDLIAPLEQARAKIEDFLGIAFEKPNLLRRETVKMTAVTYGQEWWAHCTCRRGGYAPGNDKDQDR